MMITGKIKNVVDFGAFVDLGIKETALVHISEMGDHFIKDPLATVKVGDVLEFRIISLDTQRRRIGLSRKSEQKPKVEKEKRETAAPSPAMPKRKPVVKKHDQQNKPNQSALKPRNDSRDDDGTMYNPFADAFKKIGKG